VWDVLELISFVATVRAVGCGVAYCLKMFYVRADVTTLWHYLHVVYRYMESCFITLYL